MTAIDNFGAILRDLRKLKGITQDELAFRTGRSVDAVSQWERGINWPNFETLVRLSEAFAVPVRTFFEEDTAANSERWRKELAGRLILSALTDNELAIAVEQLEALARRSRK